MSPTNFNTQRIFCLLLALLVLAGAVVGYLTHPAMYLLSIALGMTLVTVGMADAIGMGLFLARIPSAAELPVIGRRIADRW